MFVLMNTPVRSDIDAHRAAWRRIVSTVKRWPALGAPLGAALYPVEAALVDRVRDAPSTEFLVCLRPGA